VKGSNDCCTKDHPCQLGGGDCDQDEECAGDLVCGTNNCLQFNIFASYYADCCKKLGSSESITGW